MNNYQELLTQRQNQFIETRTRIEVEVNNFLNSIASLDDNTKQAFGYVDGRDKAQDWLPSLWLTPFNMDQYKLELQAFESYQSRVATLVDKLNEEAIRCLQESE